MNRYLRLLINLGLVMGLYYVLSYFNLVSWYLVLAFILLIAVFLYFQVRITDNELYFEVVCNATMYLTRIKRSADAKRDTDVFHLGLAYAAIYQGDYETVRKELTRVDDTRLTNPARQKPIYIRIRARVAHVEKDLVLLEQLLEQAEQLEQPNLIGYITTLKLDLNEQYQDMVLLLKDLIPKEVVRLHLVELEYFLALAYKELGETENALAILEFLVKKGYGIQYTDWAYDTYIEIKDNEAKNSISQ